MATPPRVDGGGAVCPHPQQSAGTPLLTYLYVGEYFWLVVTTTQRSHANTNKPKRKDASAEDAYPGTG